MAKVRNRSSESVRQLIRKLGPAMAESAINGANDVAIAMLRDIAKHNDESDPFQMSTNELIRAGNFLLLLKDSMTAKDDGSIYVFDVEADID